MIGYVINYKTLGKRTKTPSGLLVTHPLTSQIVAVGTSPLSELLVKHFTAGLRLTVRDVHSEMRALVAKPFDVTTFEAAASVWFDRARLSFVRVDIQTPLSSFVPVAVDLRAQYTGTPFEKIMLSGVSV